ncbi:MAG: hypothetical protein ABMA64_34235 [Myxococcota bacterium]
MIHWLLGAAAAAPFHPSFPVLDPSGVDVLTSGGAFSPARTCGACHDVATIDRHATHGAAGADAVGAPDRDGSLPWEWGPGLLGRWDADRYSPSDPGDLRAWAATYGQDHAGGGPLAPLGVETDCVLCHLATANDEQRRSALARGGLGLANTATLVGTGLVTLEPGGPRWDRAAFDGGRWPVERLPLGPATPERCGSCHGSVHRDPSPLVEVDGRRTRATGLVYSGQRIDRSGLNLADKDTLDRAWDVHAERLLACDDCHAAGNHPSRRVGDHAPSHLRFDPRAPPLGEYLTAPSHRLSSAEASCAGCHDPEVGHGFLPGRDVHFAALACAACHVPDVRFTARQQLDWTALDADGQPLVDWRGTDGAPSDPRALHHGYTPALLPVDGKLTPHHVSTTFLWVSGDAPVPRAALAQVWADPTALRPLDRDGDGELTLVERRLDTPERAAVVAERLRQLGVADPQIRGLLEVAPVSHGITRGAAVVRECTECHAPGGRLDRALEVAAWLPGGVVPEPRGGAAAALGPVTVDQGAAWVRRPVDERYVFGAAGFLPLDGVGLAALLGSCLFALGHGGLRWWSTRRSGGPAGGTP